MRSFTSASRYLSAAWFAVSGLLVPVSATAVVAAPEPSNLTAPSVSPAEAMKSVEAALAKTPNDPQLRFRKGVLLAEQKRSAEAIAIFRKLADDFPLLPEPQNNLAVLYAERNEPDKARAALEAALRSRPTYDTIYRNLGTVNARLAGAAYARALNIDDSKSSVARLTLVPAWAGTDAAPPLVIAQAPTPAPAPTPPASAATFVVRAAPVAAPPAVPVPAPVPKPVPVTVAPAPAPAPATATATATAPPVASVQKPVIAAAPTVVAAAPAAVKPVPAPAPAVTPEAAAANAASTAAAEEAAVR